MTNGSDLVKFEQRNYDDILHKFLGKYEQEWQAFVFEEYTNNLGD